jgi:hypothetical protein
MDAVSIGSEHGEDEGLSQLATRRCQRGMASLRTLSLKWLWASEYPRAFFRWPQGASTGSSTLLRCGYIVGPVMGMVTHVYCPRVLLLVHLRLSHLLDRLRP